MLEHDYLAEISADQLPSVNLVVPYWMDLGLAIALGVIVGVASHANATALCDTSSASVCAATCVHPRQVPSVAFAGRSVGLSDFTLNGTTRRVVCFRYEGSTDTAIVTYDEIFKGTFEP